MYSAGITKTYIVYFAGSCRNNATTLVVTTFQRSRATIRNCIVVMQGQMLIINTHRLHHTKWRAGRVPALISSTIPKCHQPRPSGGEKLCPLRDVELTVPHSVINIPLTPKADYRCTRSSCPVQSILTIITPQQLCPLVIGNGRP